METALKILRANRKMEEAAHKKAVALAVKHAGYINRVLRAGDKVGASRSVFGVYGGLYIAVRIHGINSFKDPRLARVLKAAINDNAKMSSSDDAAGGSRCYKFVIGPEFGGLEIDVDGSLAAPDDAGKNCRRVLVGSKKREFVENIYELVCD